MSAHKKEARLINRDIPPAGCSPGYMPRQATTHNTMDRILTPIATIERAIDGAHLNEIPTLIGCLAQLQAKAQLKMLARHGAMAPQTEDLLTVPEIAGRLKLSPYRVYELIRQGHLQRVPLPGKSVRVRPSDLAAYLARHGP